MPLKGIIKPRKIALEASTVCQLKCPSCPTALGKTGRFLGGDFLAFQDFKHFINANPFIAEVELSNWGEPFLNEELIPIMEYAHRRNIALYARNGSNLNTLTKDMLEAIVKYQFRAITCSIDGTNPDIYSIYRKNGDFNLVIENIKKIQKIKAQLQSSYPVLIWQYVVFGHNEAGIVQARTMAEELGMRFFVKLDWGDLYGGGEFSPIRNKALVREASGLSVADREEYKLKFGYEYVLRDCCLKIWRCPQINYDGRVLGCSINHWADFGNAFSEGLLQTINNRRINFARSVLMGREQVNGGIPCASCKYFEKMQENNEWITHAEIKQSYLPKRWYHLLVNEINKHASGRGMLKAMRSVKQDFYREGHHIRGKIASVIKRKSPLKSQIFPLQIPLTPKENRSKTSYPIFNSPTGWIDRFACHASVLLRGHRPHPPHTHEEEEMLIVLDGQINIVLQEPKYHDQEWTIPMQKGQFAYYPCNFAHTLETVGARPASYLMLKWQNSYRNVHPVLSFNQYSALDDGEQLQGKEGLSSKLIMQGKTNYLPKFHCHVSSLSPRAGYEPHSDAHDVVIIVLEGEVETLQQRVAPHGVIFYAAGEDHGMRNSGDVEAKYIVFEFHS